MDATLKKCNVDCLAFGGKTVLECHTKCADCVTTRGCWVTVANYGIPADTACHDNCYVECGTYWEDGVSDLCKCDGHNQCVFGCPGNCSPTTPNLTCNEDCLLQGTDEHDCVAFCEPCAVEKGCWADAATYGDTADVACYNDCYT